MNRYGAIDSIEVALYYIDDEYLPQIGHVINLKALPAHEKGSTAGYAILAIDYPSGQIHACMVIATSFSYG